VISRASHCYLRQAFRPYTAGIRNPRVRCPRFRREKTLCSVPPGATAPHVTSRTVLPLARRGRLPSGTGRHPLSWALHYPRRSGLHVALVLRDEDRAPRPRVPTPFLGVPLRLLMEGTICSIINGALPMHLYLGVIVRVRGCRWSTPMRWCRGRGPSLCSWIAEVFRHPARDCVGAHPVQCVWLS
ncbi:Hypothetical protein DHA2_152276, partial [Giardia duodenalis]